MRCVIRLPNGIYKEPASFEALRRCQTAERQAYIDDFYDKKGRLPNEAEVEVLESRQRSDSRSFMTRHTASEESAVKAKPEDAEQAAPPPAEIEDLKESLENQSDGGKKGITPSMAQDVTRFLNEKQGGVSPDMKSLLEATARDGPNLTDDTMRQLRQAGKAAKGSGLNLGIDPKTEKQLLEEKLPDPPPTN